jgi:transcription antitermination factor NusA-like protein
MEKDWVKIFTSTNYYQSEIIKQMLMEHQITSVLINKQDSSHRTFGNIEVYIHQDDFSKAIEIIILNQTPNL